MARLITIWILGLKNSILTYINKQCSVSQTQQTFIMFINVLGQHVSILI